MFLAVTVFGTILRDKKVFPLHVTFPPNIDTARAASPEIDMEMPVSPQKTGAAYGVIAGFQLTPRRSIWRRDTPGSSRGRPRCRSITGRRATVRARVSCYGCPMNDDPMNDIAPEGTAQIREDVEA